MEPYIGPMDMAFDLDGAGLGVRSDDNPSAIHHPSWPVLLARLVAAREASTALARETQFETAAMRGSFDEFTASWVLAHAASRLSVNPNDLGNRKSGETIFSPVAGLTRTGGRG
jgi:hypothetical protein